MQQKIGMFSATRNGKPFEEMMTLAKNMGFSALELYQYDDLQTPDLDVAKALKEKTAQLDMNICCLSVSADLMAEDIQAQRQRVKAYIQVAQAAGAPYVHFTTFPVLHYGVVSFGRIFGCCTDCFGGNGIRRPKGPTN